LIGMILGDNALFVPQDGRQSPTALMVARGVRRLLAGLGRSSLAEVTLASGRRADLVSVADDGSIWIVEVKSSVEDVRVDQKWPEYRAFCDRLFFAIPETVPEAIMPEDAGLMIADAYGAMILRAAPEHRLAPATRKAVTLRFARAAADRLHRLADPEAGTA
jgi:hypothetical protein